MLEADLILHVRDIAHPESEIQAENVRAILAELGVADDEQGGDDRGLEQDRRPAAGPRRDAARRSRRGRRGSASISALTGEGVPALLEAVAAELAEPAEDETLSLRFDQGRERAWLFDHKLVRAEHATEDGYDLDVRWTDRDRSQYQAALNSSAPEEPTSPSGVGPTFRDGVGGNVGIIWTIIIGFLAGHHRQVHHAGAATSRRASS